MRKTFLHILYNRLSSAFLVMLLFINPICASGQESYAERARNYINKYALFAIADQRATGVPASITLGQGILETEAGNSELMINANNHFGVKCKNNWAGETYLHTDDAKDECFKKYHNAQESYNDHSAHLLRNPRYKVLFSYPTVEYSKWAHGLRKCGYATNPRYGYELIHIIEEYNLHEFTLAGLDTNYQRNHPELFPAEMMEQDKEKNAAASFASNRGLLSKNQESGATQAIPPAFSDADAIAASADSARKAIAYNDSVLATAFGEATEHGVDEIRIINGLRAVYGHKDDAPLPYAVKYKIRYAHLLEINDLEDGPLPFDTYIYLEKKLTTGLKSKHAVKDGETLLQIAQQEGMQLKKLAALNHLLPTEQPVAGTALYLQETASVKPKINTAVIRVYEGYDSEASVSAAVQQQPAMAANTAITEVGFGMGFQAPKGMPVAGGDNAESDEEDDDSVQDSNQETHLITKPGQTLQPTYLYEETAPNSSNGQGAENGYDVTGPNYTVRKGDTAYSISKRYGITVLQLEKWNKIEASDLKPGQKLRIK